MARQRADWTSKGMLIAELALIALIAVVLVRAIITYIWPQSVWKPVADALPSVSAAATDATPPLNLVFDPFHRERIAALKNTNIGEDAPETTLDLKLFGLRADDGVTGSAILETPDRVQKTYRIDDEVISGVFLRGVTKTYIVLEADGVIERLTFVKPETALSRKAEEKAGEAAPDMQARKPAARAVTPAQIMASVRLSPKMSGPNLTGYTLAPRGNTKLLDTVGLKSGDIVTAVNGQALTDPATMPRLIAQLSSGKTATLTLLRDNTPLTVTIGR